MVEVAYGAIEVLRDDALRRVREPVREQQRVVLVKRAVVEDEQELGALGVLAVVRVLAVLWAERLNGVWHAFREVPEVAGVLFGKRNVKNEVVLLVWESGMEEEEIYVRRLRRKFGLQVLKCLLVFLPGVNVSIIFEFVRVFH